MWLQTQQLKQSSLSYWVLLCKYTRALWPRKKQEPVSSPSAESLQLLTGQMTAISSLLPKHQCCLSDPVNRTNCPPLHITMEGIDFARVHILSRISVKVFFTAHFSLHYGISRRLTRMPTDQGQNFFLLHLSLIYVPIHLHTHTCVWAHMCVHTHVICNL